MGIVSTRKLLTTLIPALFVLSAIAIANLALQISIPSLTRDVTAIAKIHPFSGILSNLGILLWCSTASITLFAAINIRNIKPDNNYFFLLFSGILTTYLLFDDLFLFHEDLLSSYLGINEIVIFVTLGIAVCIYLLIFRKIILLTNYSTLLLALGFLAISVVIDTILQPWLSRIGQLDFFLEDGTKWLGIVFWCDYYIVTSKQFMSPTRGCDVLLKPKNFTFPKG